MWYTLKHTHRMLLSYEKEGNIGHLHQHGWTLIEEDIQFSLFLTKYVEHDLIVRCMGTV